MAIIVERSISDEGDGQENRIAASSAKCKGNRAGWSFYHGQASCGMAALTVSLVVSGPGVNSRLSFVVREIFKFVAVSVESIRQHHASHDRVRSGLPHALPANVCGIQDDIFNRI